jgi:hypothetical protein
VAEIRDLVSTDGDQEIPDNRCAVSGMTPL